MLSKNTLALLGLAACTLQARATHIIGGEMFYTHQSGDLYQVTVKLYRDCSGIAFDNTINIGVYSGTGTFLFYQTVVFPGGTNVPIVLDSPCLTLPPNICVQTTSYITNFTLPPTSSGYVLSYIRCCRTSIIDNIVTPGDQGLTVMCRIPPATMGLNSSPRFNELPPIALCVNEPLTFDHAATDPDGDELVYELCTPFNGGSSANPNPIPSQATAPPYPSLPWGPGYSANYPIDSNPAIAINPVTGQLTLTPTQLGNYVVGVCVSEYRDGVLLSTTRRDFLFKVVACDATVNSVIAPQTQFCTGLTQNFTNTSVGGQSFFWNFGDPTTLADTAVTANASWTYAQPGTYNVMLVTNPGTVCADTAYAVFQVYLPPTPSFTPPPPTCGPTQVTLTATGFGPGATVNWNLGSGASPPTATGNPVTASFAANGVQPVTVTVTENGCTASYSADVVAWPLPNAVIQPQQQFCTGLTMTFGNLSQGASGYQWNFGDPGNPGAGSTQSSPTHTYSQPGTHTVTLIATTANGCADTTQAIFQVYQAPAPYFEQPPVTCGALATSFTALGSFGPGANVSWNFGAGAVPPTATGVQASTVFSPGNQTVTLTVTENGCTGSFTDSFQVFPAPDAYFTSSLPSPQLMGTTITFTDLSNGNGGTIVSWVWSLNGEVVASGSPFVWNDPMPGTYAVTLTVTTADGCTDTYTIYFEIYPGDISIPNVFSPNGDGLNDFFVIENAQYLKNTLQIFNRWGMPIYETSNYKNNWRGTDVPDGTYYYVFTLNDGRTWTGHLTLLR